VKALSVRPSDLLSALCAAGAGGAARVARSPRHARALDTLMARIGREPTVPVALRCTVSGVYAFQNPRRLAGDDPEAGTRRDLQVLQRLGLAPGDTRPAVELLRRMIERTADLHGLCAPECTREVLEAGLAALVPGRPAAEMARAKEESVRAMREADALRIRPHHLMCMACFHAGRETLAPIAEDNLFEAVDIVQSNPDMPVTLVKGCCMICPPCASYEPGTNRCTGDIGMSLRDEKKDLDVLALTGLSYGRTLPARELYRLLFERVPSTKLVCGHGDGLLRGREWRVCGGPDGDPRYLRAREKGLGIRGLAEPRV
jgi:hypothetical protein